LAREFVIFHGQFFAQSDYLAFGEGARFDGSRRKLGGIAFRTATELFSDVIFKSVSIAHLHFHSQISFSVRRDVIPLLEVTVGHGATVGGDGGAVTEIGEGGYGSC